MKKFIIAVVMLLAAAAAILYISPAALTASVRLVERQLAGLSEQQVALGDLSIHYYEGGPAKGETIVMIHGFGANKDNWLQFARHFTQRYHVIALDLPGFGDSDRPAGSYDVGTQAERLESFIKTLELGKVHLVGNSMGGHIAGLFAARYPQQALSLALFDNSGVTAPNESELFHLIETGQPNPLVVRSSGDFQRMLDFVFVDHDKAAYLPDLERIMAEGWLHPGSIVVADNVRIPGAPAYRRHMQAAEGRTWRTIEHHTHVEYQSLLKDLVLESEYLGPHS